MLRRQARHFRQGNSKVTSSFENILLEYVILPNLSNPAFMGLIHCICVRPFFYRRIPPRIERGLVVLSFCIPVFFLNTFFDDERDIERRFMIFSPCEVSQLIF